MTPRVRVPQRRQAPLPLAAALVALAALATSCSTGSTARQASTLQDRVRVSGEFGAKPAITVAAPLKVPTSRSWTLRSGKGEKVAADGTAILQLTMADGRTGKTVLSTSDAGQHPLEAKLTEQLFPSLVKALAGVSAGSRVVVASTAAEAYGAQGAPQLGIEPGDSVVLVADVLSTDPTKVLPGPTGASSPEHAGLSSTFPVGVDEGPDGPTRVRFPGGTPPTKPETVLRREGTGAAVSGPTRIVADYLGQVWGAEEPFESTYAKEPARFSIGIGSVLPCWDRALEGVRAGARVVMVCPPATAYGGSAKPGIPAGSTLVFVVDVLGVG